MLILKLILTLTFLKKMRFLCIVQCKINQEEYMVALLKNLVTSHLEETPRRRFIPMVIIKKKALCFIVIRKHLCQTFLIV